MSGAPGPGALRLQTRIFLWFLAAILAGAMGSIAASLLRTDPSAGPAQVMARTIGAHLAARWDDPRATDAYVAEMHSLTGIDFHLYRGKAHLPHVVGRTVRRGAALGIAPGEGAFIPVVRDGHVVGAVSFPLPAHHRNRQLAFLVAALLVLVVAARRVSARVVRPLEQVAHAAARFGGGDLAARTEVDRRASPEVVEVAGAFDAMAGRVERLIKDQRELLAAVSHELRSPLGRARVALELARDQAPEASALDRVERHLGEVNGILGDLLAVTRAGLSDLRKEPLALTTWLRERFPTVEGVEVEVQGEEVEVQADASMLARAVQNVLENAVHHGHPATEVLRVHVTKKDGAAHVVVSDRGPGFPEELLPRAFDPFVRGDPARTTTDASTGLGLSIVRRIAEAHGGSASARNTRGPDGEVCGAEITLVLPT